MTKSKVFSSTGVELGIEADTDECVEWDGCFVGGNWYGVFKENGVQCSAHRRAYEERVGPIPDGLCVLHRCDNPACVNSDHLFLGTQKDNILDRVIKGRSGNQHSQKPSLRSQLKLRVRSGRSPLNAKQVKAIRSLDGTIGAVALARRYGVLPATIRNIWRRRTWGKI